MNTDTVLLLPEDAAPMEKYQNISNAIQLIWEYPELIAYLDKLIVNDVTRFDRAGFSPEVLSDLMSIYVIAKDTSSVKTPESIW
jgi:hypothetical protein